MTIRQKTIEYAFDTPTSGAAAGARHDFTAVTLYIPETSSRTFRSVFLEVYARQTDIAATSMSSWLLGIKLGAVAFDDASISHTITNSGELTAWKFTRDVTSYFTTNFSGSSMTCQVGFSFGAVAVNNMHAKIYITYDYDDASATTRVKTVRIPLESATGRLTTTLAEIGTNQVPNLDNLLPEASKTYRQKWFEVYANESLVATTDMQLCLALDAEAEAADGSHENNQLTGLWYKRIWVRDDMTTNATHAFKARSTVTNTFTNLSVMLCVTYEYDHSSSTSLLNSLLLPSVSSGAIFGGTAGGDLQRQQFEWWIEEPTTITLKQSAFVGFFNASNTVAVQMAAGGQATVTYTATQASIQAGQYSVHHRIDSGGGSGTNALTLARGLNTLTVDWYSDQLGIGQNGNNLTGFLCLNYTSGKATGGDGVHNHTTIWHVAGPVASSSPGYVETSAAAPAIPETSFYTTGIALVAHMLRGASANGGGFAILAEMKSGEGPADGWAEVFTSMLESEDELGIYYEVANANSFFQRHPSDPDTTRMAVETTRKYRVHATAHHYTSLLIYLTTHAITYAAAGTVSGYSGDGSGITVNIHRADNFERVTSATTASGGTYSATWYDNAINVYAAARQDSTHVGRSDNAAAA